MDIQQNNGKGVLGPLKKNGNEIGVFILVRFLGWTGPLFILGKFAKAIFCHVTTAVVGCAQGKQVNP